MLLLFCLWSIGTNLLLNNNVDAMTIEQDKPTNLHSLSLEEREKFRVSFDAIISDCDGVLHNPKGVIKNADQAIGELTAKQGKIVYYVTNNAAQTKAQIAMKLKNLGFINASENSVISPAGLVADYLRDKISPGQAVYVVGPSAVCEELNKYNIFCFGPGRDDMDENLVESLIKSTFKLEESKYYVGAVVVGKDVYINYLKILKAFTYLQNKDCLFLATSTDETYSTGSGTQFPDSGPMVAAISNVSGREPYILGKPGVHLMDVLRSKHNPERTIFVGDRLNTDILMGNRCSFRTVLVLTGCHGLNDIDTYRKSNKTEDQMSIPDYYTNAFSDLVL